MALQVKYYSFVDPVTGTATKDVGWESTSDVRSFQIKEIKGVLTTTRDVTKSVTNFSKPKGDQLKELSKDEYDKLDVSGEHPFLAERRAKNEGRLATQDTPAVQYRAAKLGKAVPMTPEKVKVALAKLRA